MPDKNLNIELIDSVGDQDNRKDEELKIELEKILGNINYTKQGLNIILYLFGSNRPSGEELDRLQLYIDLYGKEKFEERFIIVFNMVEKYPCPRGQKLEETIEKFISSVKEMIQNRNINI